MKASTYVLALGLVSIAQAAWAYEYPLQYTPNGGARGGQPNPLVRAPFPSGRRPGPATTVCDHDSRRS